MAMADDTAAFFDLSEFAVTATYEGGDILGILTDLPTEANVGEGPPVAGHQPILRVRAADVTPALGDSVTIGADSYAVREWTYSTDRLLVDLTLEVL